MALASAAAAAGGDLFALFVVVWAPSSRAIVLLPTSPCLNVVVHPRALARSSSSVLRRRYEFAWVVVLKSQHEHDYSPLTRVVQFSLLVVRTQSANTEILLLNPEKRYMSVLQDEVDARQA